ncbi:MAG: cupin domain-containing protein [Flavobacteriaceae bacterium]|nr:cupin domain-containing protein [Flavobacteriaceae bacterium]
MIAKEIIEALGLQEHPEGGYFKETYRSKETISNKELDAKYVGDRHHCTGIYFLLTSEKFSAFHKVNQDEMWHYYKGAPIKLHTISPEGTYSFVMIGNNFENGETPQHVVKGGDWFAAEVLEKDSCCLVGCTVAPGFDFADFVLPTREELMSKYPDHKKTISRLTHY